ncbi:hypothetical protein BGZ60DRAFT_219809 [Tricladium varicosporioides]|nr:hypothetical protein BGZ60DRAFT_219809 [Hymenoscyphus varicosporioides]
MCSEMLNYHQANKSVNSNEYPDSTTAINYSTDTGPFFDCPSKPGQACGPFRFMTTTNHGITTTIQGTSNNLCRIFGRASSKSTNNSYEIEEHVAAYKAIEVGAANNMAEILNGHLEIILGVANGQYKNLIQQSRNNSQQVPDDHINKITGVSVARSSPFHNPTHIDEYKKLLEQAKHRNERSLEGHMNKLVGAIPRRSASLNDKNNTITLSDTIPVQDSISARRTTNMVERAKAGSTSGLVCKEEEELEGFKGKGEHKKVKASFEKKANEAKMLFKHLFSGCFSRWDKELRGP